MMQRLGILDADLSIRSKMPESAVAGLSNEFANNAAVTADLIWIDFSPSASLSSISTASPLRVPAPSCEDIYAPSASCSWPVGGRWMLGAGGLVTNQMIDDEVRTMTLRLDALWSLGLAAEWRWTDARSLKLSVST